MPVIGDAPITSYFSRVPSTSKRKGRSDGESLPSHKRRNQGAISTTSAAPSSSKKKGNERDILDFYETKPSPPRKAGRARACVDLMELTSPRTPMPKVSSRGNERTEVIPPTPPATADIAQRRPRVSHEEIQLGPSTSASPPRLITSLPTPITKPRPQTRSFMKRVGSVTGLPLTTSPSTSHTLTSKATAPFEFLTHPTNPSSEFAELSIPSSQSQILLDIPHHEILASELTLATSKSPMPVDHDDLITIQYGNIPTEMNVDADNFVGSSQSQPELFVPVSPKRQKRKRNPLTINVTHSCLEIVPSSQSQERELVIPPLETLRSRLQSQQGFLSSQTSSRVHNSQNRAPQRTLSDEIFPVPIQHSLFADIFPDDDDLEIQRAGTPAHVPENEDSVTESETEDESCQMPRLDNATHLRRGSSQREAESLPSQLANTQDYLASQSSTGWDIGSSCASLPPAVKEFQNMFGNDNESYPADFPESLRS